MFMSTMQSPACHSCNSQKHTNPPPVPVKVMML